MPKRWKLNLHQIYSIKTKMIWYHKGSVAILFWDQKRLWLGSGGLKCENSVPKFEREYHPDHWGGPIDPKLCGPSSFKYGLHQKSHISGHLLRRPPLAISACATSAPCKIPKFTPELRGEWSSPWKIFWFTKGLVQCVSNGVRSCSVTFSKFLIASHPLGLSACFPGKLRKKLAIQHNFQLPKRWSGWGDMPNLGVLDRFARGGGGGCTGTTTCIRNTCIYTVYTPYIYTYTEIPYWVLANTTHI